MHTIGGTTGTDVNPSDFLFFPLVTGLVVAIIIVRALFVHYVSEIYQIISNFFVQKVRSAS